MNVLDFHAKKKKNEKISMITCYDFSFARILNASPVDILLVGDSAANTMLGHSSTLPISLETMVELTAAVARGAPNKFIVGDMPFLSYRKDMASNVTAAGAFMKAGAHAVKLEGADGNLELVHHLVQSGIPVMGHLGLTPQSIHQLGGFRVQGRDENAATRIKEHALALEKAGAFALVLECVPTGLSGPMTQSLHIPTIGIGAGPDVDGQVLVLQDMLGMNPEFRPKFLRTYFDGYQQLGQVFARFHEDVKNGKFPSPEESYL